MNFLLIKKSTSYIIHMFNTGLAECEKRFFSNYGSKIFKVIISKYCFTDVKLNIGNKLFDKKIFDLR